MLIQQIITKSPLKTQTHLTETFIHADQKYFTSKGIIFIQLNILKSITNLKNLEYTNPNQTIYIQFSNQFDSFQIINGRLSKITKIKNQDKSINQWLHQNQRSFIQIYYIIRKRKIDELKSNNQLIINDFNKQLKNILKSLIQNDIQKINKGISLSQTYWIFNFKEISF
ncbi:unnamed protein product [Paramecium pentaurelia]|uniref:Uncharacterized protein n=1 Tax=Paramecium pentaurelia TaxID=43138 RepID=A0A8S1WB34_9CILI|nr:unnamed protein product [Paramecium pentaurelia]